MKTKALYAGSFDPFTLGHLDVVNKALEKYDEVIICVAINDTKEPLFNTDYRIKLIESVFENHPKRNLISIIYSSKLTVETAYDYKVDALIRGLRSNTDEIAEQTLENTNQKLALIRGFSIKTDFIVQRTPFLQSVSSSLVKALYQKNEFIAAQDYVPPTVHNAMMSYYLLQLLMRNNIPIEIEAYDKIITAYSEHSYHNLTHLGYMLNMLQIYIDATKHRVPLRQMITAILVHGLIYNPYKPNQKRAVINFNKWCQRLSIMKAYKEDIEKLVQTLWTNDPMQDKDCALMSDLDLSILGTFNPDTWKTYCQDIRNEYPELSDKEYISSRIIYLQELLDRKKIFYTKFFNQRYEKQARTNILTEINRLRLLS